VSFINSTTQDDIVEMMVFILKVAIIAGVIVFLLAVLRFRK